MRYVCVFVFMAYCLQYIQCKSPIAFEQRPPANRYDNPDQIRDRQRHLEQKAFESGKEKGIVGIHRPMLGEKWKNRHRQPYHPAWMDYCDPYHCNDYHKTACGYNRANGRFKWFQSGCHIALNNKCHTYRGTLKYDMIEPKHCYRYVMHLRSNCPQQCSNDLEPVCGISSYDQHVVVFKNMCYLDQANCRDTSFNGQCTLRCKCVRVRSRPPECLRV